MRRFPLRIAVLSLLTAPLLQAAETTASLAPGDWHATTLLEAVALMVLFSALGIAMAVIGYKVFDKLTPGDLHREIIENRNVAAAILGGAIILGVCVIIAAAMLG